MVDQSRFVTAVAGQQSYALPQVRGVPSFVRVNGAAATFTTSQTGLVVTVIISSPTVTAGQQIEIGGTLPAHH